MKNYEQKVRMLDDASKSILASAAELSKRLGIVTATCAGYIHAKRIGYPSIKEYKNALAKAKGFNSKSEQTGFNRARREHGESYTLEQYRSNPKSKKAERAANQRALMQHLRTYSVPLNSLTTELPETEQRVRALDNPALNIADSARNASTQTGLSRIACFNYISSLRKGVTHRIYADFRIRKKGFVDHYESESYIKAKSKNKKLTLDEFRAEKARRIGFSCFECYLRFLEDKRLFFPQSWGQKQQRRSSLQKKFEYADVKLHNPDKLDKFFASEDNLLDPIDKEAFWEFIRSTLKDKEYRVLYSRFAEKKSWGEISNDLKQTRANAEQIVAKALRKLRHPCRIKFFKDFLR